MDKVITLEEYVNEVLEKEKMAKEVAEVTNNIKSTALAVYEVAESKKNIHIITDYDTDGLTSAYEMRSTILAVNPDAKIEVTPNDRRYAYGVPKDIKAEENTAYIILDMGSNELPYIYDTFGADNIIMLDHHLIEEPTNKNEIINNPKLLNPKAYQQNDSKYAEYCTAGLALRVYEEVKAIAQEKAPNKTFGNEKTDNTIRIMGAVGTMGDVVDINDIHSDNRRIVKQGMKAIDNADEQNTDFMIGSLLSKAGIGMEDCIAKDLAFNVSALLNAPSRMSEVYQFNGAKYMFDTLIADPDKSASHYAMEDMANINIERKSLLRNITDSEHYKSFVAENQLTEENVIVFECPSDTPHAIAGLVASRLADNIDKAVIACVYDAKSNSYMGSGRIGSMEGSLKEFVDMVVNSEEAKQAGLKMSYGGHHGAIGISSCNDLKAFSEIVSKYSTEMQKPQDRIYLAPFDMQSEKNLQLLKSIEPLGQGNKPYPILYTIHEQYRSQLFKAQNPNWKTIKGNLVDENRQLVKTTDANGKSSNVTVKLDDWEYNPNNYPLLPNDKGKNTVIKVLASCDLGTYKGLNIDATVKFDRDILQSAYKELGQDIIKPSKFREQKNQELKKNDISYDK